MKSIRRTNEKGITLIALVLTIIVLLIKEKTNKANIIIILLFIPSPKYFMMYIH